MQPLYPNRINWQNLPSFDTPLGASNLNKMDYAIYGLDQRVLTLTGYQDSASQSAKNAKASEVSAKTSELNASASEEMARQYAEQAFSGTPDGYDLLVDKVYKMDIKTTTDTTLADSKAGGYKLVSMSGNSVQNGEPTPTNPIVINNVADSVEIVKGDYGNSAGEYRPQTNGYICSKNPIPCKSGDVITLKLKSANNGWFYFYNKSGLMAIQKVENNTTISKIATEGATHFTFAIGNGSTTLDNIGKITLTINDKYVLQIKTYDDNGNETVATVLLNEPFRESDIMSRTEVERNAMEIIFDSTTVTEHIGIADASSGVFYFYHNMANLEPTVCTHFNRLDDVDITGNSTAVARLSNGQFVKRYGTTNDRIYFKNSGFASVDDVVEYLQTNSIVFLCKTTTPTIEVLNTASQIALNSLETFDTVTYIAVDSRTQPSEIKSEYGTSIVGARTLKNELRNDNLEIKYNELQVALVAMGSEV